MAWGGHEPEHQSPGPQPHPSRTEIEPQERKRRVRVLAAPSPVLAVDDSRLVWMQLQPDLAHPRMQCRKDFLGLGEAIAVQDSIIRASPARPRETRRELPAYPNQCTHAEVMSSTGSARPTSASRRLKCIAVYVETPRALPSPVLGLRLAQAEIRGRAISKTERLFHRRWDVVEPSMSP